MRDDVELRATQTETVPASCNAPPRVAGGTTTPHRLYLFLSARTGACVSRRAFPGVISFLFHGRLCRLVRSGGRLRVETPRHRPDHGPLRSRWWVWMRPALCSCLTCAAYVLVTDAAGSRR